MNIKELNILKKEASDDLTITDANILDKTREAPYLFSKYLAYYLRESLILKKQKIELDKIYADRYKFYKEDYSRELTKGDIEYYINKDESYYTKNNEYQIQESICMYLEGITKRANGLSFDVKNYIDLKLFMAGSK